MLLNPRAEFSLAVRLREPDGAEIGDVFSFLSKLYFRGKLTYARAFASATRRRPADPRHHRGPRTRSAGNATPARRPRAVLSGRHFCRRRALPRSVASRCERSVVEARERRQRRSSSAASRRGSTSTRCWTSSASGSCSRASSSGRGDMSRGGLLLRSAREGRELEYIPVAGAVRRGKRPPKLDPAAAEPVSRSGVGHASELEPIRRRCSTYLRFNIMCCNIYIAVTTAIGLDANSCTASVGSWTQRRNSPCHSFNRSPIARQTSR